MTFRIRPGEPLSREVRRVGRDQLEKAIDVLYNEPAGRHEAIHDARKRFKKMRGLLRLVRTEASDLYSVENARLRDAARSLSGVRDATALVETLDRLAARETGRQEQAVLLAIRHRLEARRDAIASAGEDLDERIAAAISACEDALAALDGLDLPKGTGKAGKVVSKGFAKTYARAVEAFGRARETGDPADWHELRKRMKYHWMHIKLMRPLWPGEMRLRARAANQAAQMLGEDHDLAVLIALADTGPGTIGTKEEIAVLIAAAKAESKRLREAIAKALHPMLADDPKLVRRKIEVLYRDAA